LAAAHRGLIEVEHRPLGGAPIVVAHVLSEVTEGALKLAPDTIVRFLDGGEHPRRNSVVEACQGCAVGRTLRRKGRNKQEQGGKEGGTSHERHRTGGSLGT
jgi:hypothetical protein